MGSNSDQWVADIASFVRNGFGNTGTAGDSRPTSRACAAADGATQDAMDGRRARSARCRGRSLPDASWKVTASHDARPAPQANAEGGYNYVGNAAGALSFLGWTTGVPQQAGMWFQIELPAPVMLAEIQFTSSTDRRRVRRAGAWTFPRRYQVQVSSDGTTWSAPVAEGEGSPGHDRDHFAPAARGSCASRRRPAVDNAPPWSMRLLRLYAASEQTAR